jgi:autotransporter-associated beta strand protein
VADVILRLGRLEVADDIRLKLDVSADQTLSEVIANADVPGGAGGQLEKLGAATLTLLGVNTYSGGTTVSNGTLKGNNDSLQGDFDLTNANARLVFEQTAIDLAGSLYLGTISGSGHVEKTGVGLLTLVNIVGPSGAFEHSGGTTVTDGILATDPANLRSDGVNPTGNVIIGELGTLVFIAPAGETESAHDVTGAGELGKVGPDTVTLTGKYAHTGGTIVADGPLKVATLDFQGNVVFGDPRTEALLEEIGITPSPQKLIFDQGSADSRFVGNITDSTDPMVDVDGIVEKEGAGTLTLVGANTYSGGTFVNGGMLQGDTDSLQGSINLAAGTAVRFDQASDDSFEGVIDGAGGLVKLGEGRLTVTQDQSFTGPTTISAGRLDLATPTAPGPTLINSVGSTWRPRPHRVRPSSTATSRSMRAQSSGETARSTTA